MFNETWPWKRELRRIARSLEEDRFKLTKKLGKAVEESEVLYFVERDVMFGCFAVRRLLGMQSKVTKSIRKAKVAVTEYAKIEGTPPIDASTVYGELEIYDYENPKSVRISANAMCNLFVHSYVLRFVWTRGGIDWDQWYRHAEDSVEADELCGFLVASDEGVAQRLTFVSLGEIVRLFLAVADDEVVMLRMRRDSNGRMHATAFGADDIEQRHL